MINPFIRVYPSSLNHDQKRSHTRLSITPSEKGRIDFVTLVDVDHFVGHAPGNPCWAWKIGTIHQNKNIREETNMALNKKKGKAVSPSQTFVIEELMEDAKGNLRLVKPEDLYIRNHPGVRAAFRMLYEWLGESNKS